VKKVIQNQGLTQESFDKLLAWLHPDRNQAGEKYEAIRRELIGLFLLWGSTSPENLTDETIDCVANDIDKIARKYVGDPEAYFCRTARSVYLRSHRRWSKQPLSIAA